MQWERVKNQSLVYKEEVALKEEVVHLLLKLSDVGVSMKYRVKN